MPCSSESSEHAEAAGPGPCDFGDRCDNINQNQETGKSKVRIVMNQRGERGGKTNVQYAPFKERFLTNQRSDEHVRTIRLIHSCGSGYAAYFSPFVTFVQ